MAGFEQKFTESPIRRLAKGSSIYGIGALLPKLIGVILIPIYTRYLTTSDYGILAYVATIHSVLFILSEMGMGHAVLRFYFDHRDDEERLRTYLGTIQLFLFGANLVVAAVLIGFGERIFSFLSFPFNPYVLIGVVTTFFALGSIVPLELFRAREQATRYVAFQVTTFVLTALAIIYFVVVKGQGALGSLKGRLIVTALFCAVYWAFLFKEIRLRIAKRFLAESLKFGLPLVPMMLANWVLTFSDRVIMERMLTIADVGVYALGYTVGMIMGDVVRSIHKAYVPQFFDTLKTEKDAPRVVAKVALAYLGFVTAVALFGVLFCREGILILATEPYYGAATVAPFVIVGYLLRGMNYMTANPLYYLKRTGVLAWSTVLAAALNVGLNFLLIPAFGIVGAAYSTVIAYAAAFALVYVRAQRLYPVPYDLPRVTGTLLLFACCAAAGALPEWSGWLVPIAVKSALMLAFGAGLLLLGVVKRSANS